MIAPSQFLLSLFTMVVALASFFWAYETTIVTVLRHKSDRRASFRPQTRDRRNQAASVTQSNVEYWLHRIAWLLVAVMICVDFAVTLGSGIGF